MESFQIDLIYVWVELFSKSFVHYYLQKKTNNWELWVAFQRVESNFCCSEVHGSFPKGVFIINQSRLW